MTSIGDRVVFSADDGTGRAYWVSDGTDAGTWALNRSAVPSLFRRVQTSTVLSLFEGGGILGTSDGILFPAGDVAGNELWSSDGTPGNGTRLMDLNPGPPSSNPARLTSSGGNVFFIASDSTGFGLWVLAGDGGVTSGSDGGQPADGGRSGGPDAGSTSDAGSGSGADGGGGATSKSGCGCGQTSGPLACLLGALALVAASRRRRAA